MEQTFRKRPGTTNKGTENEILTIANISMKLVTDDKIKDFRISCNHEDFGDFDDIVVETHLENGTETYALQLKHNDRGHLSLKQLTRDKGDFSIKKYFASVQTLKISETKLILYTNLKCNLTEGVKFHLDGEDFPIIATKINPNNAFDISENNNYCYKFSIVKDGTYENSSTVSLYERFFQYFFLYVEQENLYDLERSVIEKFQTSFCGNHVECNEYVRFLNKWNSEAGRKDKLDKKFVKLVIALKIFSSRIKPLAFNHPNEATEIVKRNILREAIASFEVTIFERDSYDEVKKLWNDAKSELEDLKTVNNLRTKYQLASTHISNIDQIDSSNSSILLWLMGKCPLILTQDASIDRALELCRGEKFILLDNVDSFPENIHTFKTLTDLKPKTFEYDNLIQHFTCSLQGKEEISLTDLIDRNDEILTVLKTDHLLEMLKNECRIGVVKEKLPEPYIERSVLKNAIDFKILNNATKDTVVILDCVQQNNDLHDKLKNHTLININAEKDSTLNAENINDAKSHKKESSLRSRIYLSEKRCEYDEFYAICNKTKFAKHFHQFRVRDAGNLEWIRSKGDISDVERYKLSEYYPVHERDLGSSEFEHINLLVSDPGMGKSELMKSFKIKCLPEYVTVSIDPKDVYSFLKITRDADYVNAFHEFLLDEKYKSLSDRDKDIFRIFLKTHRIICVWDALDELSDKHRDIVTDIIVELSENCVQWVTSRCHLQNMLQKKFNVLAVSLKKFGEEEQRDYIRERLTDTSPTATIEIIIQKIKSSFVLVEHKDILGIPLQLFMLTELFLQDGHKYAAVLNNLFLLTDLYNYFIEEKINILYREKLGIDLNTSSAEWLVQNQKETIVEEYTNAALRLLFPDTIFKHLAVKNKENFQAIHDSHRNIGLVTEMKDQIPRFLHSSFAEYLAARYFASNPEHKDVRTRVMFDPKYSNVRFFFDLILARDSEAHVAVLYRNFSFVKNCDSDRILTRRDTGRRSALHLACSWGQRYPELNVDCIAGAYIIDDDGKFPTVPDTKEYLETIDRLIEKCDVSESDDIYNITPGEYARKTTCCGSEMRIMMKDSTLEPIEIDHIIKLLYHSAHYGHYPEFVIFSFELSVQVRRNRRTNRKISYRVVADIENNTRMTLLYVAATMGHVKIVEFLIKVGADFNLADNDGFTPLYVASRNGHLKVAELLVKAGADVNLVSEESSTPLNIASFKGHLKIVEFLVKAGADIDLVDTVGDTALKIASQNGYLNIVEFLVKAGADINFVSKYGLTPLYIASFYGHLKIVEFLVEADADINLTGVDGLTALYSAADNGNDKIAEFLIKAGANINLANKEGVTPLYVASQNGHINIVKLLVESDADINLAARDGFSFTSLYIAATKGHIRTVEILIEAGADINLANKIGWTPLNATCENGDDEIVDLLLKAGADVHLPNRDGWKPLSVSSQYGHLKIVELLVRAGADVNLANRNGFAPLYIASLKGHLEIVEFLVGSGADMNLANKDGWTPLHRAAFRGYKEIVVFLVAAGADIDVITNLGYTPLQLASNQKHGDIVSFLKESKRSKTD